MMTSLQLLRELRPKSRVLENVTGLREAHSSDGKSPLSYITEQLEQMDYKCGVIDVDLGSWMTASRKRIALVLQQLKLYKR